MKKRNLRQNHKIVMRMSDKWLTRFVKNNPRIESALPYGWERNPHTYKFQIIGKMNTLHMSEEEYRQHETTLDSWFGIK